MLIRLLSVCTIGSFNESLASNYKERINCVSLKNQSYKARPALFGVNSKETLFYPFTAGINK